MTKYSAVIIVNNSGSDITVTNDGTPNNTNSINLSGATNNGTVSNETTKTFFGSGPIIIATGGSNSLIVSEGGVALY